MYLGRAQAGTWLDVYFQCVNASRTPLMPDKPPVIKIRNSAGAVILSDLMPVVDKTVNIGLFCSRIFLDTRFSVGICSVEMVYFLAGSMRLAVRGFEVMAAGNGQGQVLSQYYFHTPQAELIVYQVESGALLRGKNPRVR